MALEVDIEKRAGSFHLRTSFTAGEGILGILGASGCGKSMTLRCVAGIDRPDRGRIALDGRVLFDSERKIDLPPQARRVGYLFQSYALFPGMTVRQNILCALHAERDGRKREARADEIMDLLQIRPIAALDTHLRLRLQMELRNLLSGYGRSVVMVTHDRDEAFRMCDRLGVMENGRMLAVKDAREMFADPQTRAAAVLTGCKNIAGARKTGERQVFVPDWNVHLTTGRPVRNAVAAVGIRAHYLRPEVAANRFPVHFLREMEEPFAWVSEFRYADQSPDTPALWWRYGKQQRPAVLPKALVVAPEDVLLLY